METLAHLPFILIGDSGQEDPEIYSEVVKLYPDRVLAIYIRNVSQNPARSNLIRTLAEDVAAAGSTLILADDTSAAAQHAISRGWILEQNYLRP
jgi:phosphatidate phosphatase APP1